MMPNLARTVHPIHFEDFSGAQFERLVFAFHLRIESWQSLQWYGQTGSDLGRDIWGVTETGDTVCIQCVNRENLTFKKICDDLSKVLRSPNGAPDKFRIITRASVPATRRDKIKSHVRREGVKDCEIWSGSEFEEFLHAKAESLLKRFFHGDEFPDSESALSSFVKNGDSGTKELTREAAQSLIRSYKDTIQSFLGGKLPPLVESDLPDRGKNLIQLLSKPGNRFVIGPSGTAKTFHLDHLAVSLIHEDSEIPIFANAKSYMGEPFDDHLRRHAAPYLESHFDDLIEACKICGLRLVLLLDALNECPVRHETDLLTGAQAFMLQQKARLVGASQAGPPLTGNLQSELVPISLPVAGEKQHIYAYHAGVPVSPEIDYLSEQFSNAYDLAIAGRCHANHSKPQSRVDLYDRFVRQALPGNATLWSAFLRDIAQEMSTRLMLVFDRNEFSRRAEHFLKEQRAAFAAYDDLLRSRLLDVSPSQISFEHELLFSYFRGEALLRRCPSILELCQELRRPRNHDLLEIILPRFSEQNDLDALLLTSPSTEVLARVLSGVSGAAAKVALERRCISLLDDAYQDLSNLSIECDVATTDEVKRRIVGVRIQGAREWTEIDQHVCAVISQNLNQPAFADKFLMLLDKTEACLRDCATLAAERNNLKPLRVWEEIVRSYGGSLSWGSLALPYSAIVSSIHSARFTTRHAKGVASLQEDLIRRAFSEHGSHLALHLLSQHWRERISGSLGEDSDIDRKLMTAQLGFASGIGTLQLDAIDLLRWMGSELADATELQKQRARGILESFEPKDIILNSFKMEVMAFHGELELLVSEEDAVTEMRRLLQCGGLSLDINELAELTDMTLDEYRREAAYGCIARIFEDIFQGVYWNAYNALEQSEKTELLCLAAMSKRPGFSSDWILTELGHFDAPEVLPVYAHWTSGIEVESFSRQEAVMCFMLAILGWAKSEPEPPAYRIPNSTEDRAWKLVGEVLYWHFRAGAEGRSKRIVALWQRTSEEAPNAVADVLFHLSHAQWHSREKPFPVRLEIEYPEQVSPLLEHALRNVMDLTSIFPNGGPRDASLLNFIFGALGNTAGANTIPLLANWIDSPRYGKTALDAIASIRSRMG